VLKSRLSTFLHLSWPDRWLLLESGLWLWLARAAVLTIPFRWLASRLGQQHGMSPIVDNPEALAQIRRVAWAIRVVSRATPWQSNCLAQALAGKWMLHRRRIASTLYLGVAKDAQGRLEAHAWLRSGDSILTGGSDLERYAIVAIFAETFAATACRLNEVQR